ncbi:hypothetical protein NKJ06_24885 [Mesorhizobium sp. M0293]|uniref:hypothetical protein n=1 Tax=unclassified Mesorhizobium TaxID=325217 RepID=UPI00333D3B82
MAETIQRAIAEGNAADHALEVMLPAILRWQAFDVAKRYSVPATGSLVEEL